MTDSTDSTVENEPVKETKSDTANPWTLSLDSVSSFVSPTIESGFEGNKKCTDLSSPVDNNPRESRDGETLLCRESRDGETTLYHRESRDGETLYHRESRDGETLCHRESRNGETSLYHTESSDGEMLLDQQRRKHHDEDIPRTKYPTLRVLLTNSSHVANGSSAPTEMQEEKIKGDLWISVG